MTDEQLRQYVRLVADALGLKDWSFYAERKDSEDNTAECACVYGRQYATIRFDRAFFEETPDEQRIIVIHELLHCHHAPVDELIENALPHVMTEQQHNVFMATYRVNMERMIDPVAVAIAGMGAIPLPPEPDITVE